MTVIILRKWNNPALATERDRCHKTAGILFKPDSKALSLHSPTLNTTVLHRLL